MRALAVCIALFGFSSLAAAQTRTDLTKARNKMVDEEIVGAGVKNPRVIESMRTTLRHEFVGGTEQRKLAYFDMALPIGEAQTISPPFIVAYMTEQLDPQPTDVVLEIGTGSGYQAAVLSPLVKEVYSIEIVKSLGEHAARTLKRLKYENVFTKVGDGYLGWPEHAPFDKIIVTCSPEKVPQPLVDQLREGGKMVIPLGERYQQTLYMFTKQDGKLVSEKLQPMLFVPMTGAAESKREVLPDPKNPKIRNGGFEEAGEGNQPAGWHYVRQLDWIDDAHAPQGSHFITLHNDQPGRGSRALQGLAVDGRAIKALEFSCRVKAENVRPGQTPDELPQLLITFYDERRATVGNPELGPFRGTFDWQTESREISVPPKAREAIVRVDMMGAVGRLSLDAIELKIVERTKGER